MTVLKKSRTRSLPERHAQRGHRRGVFGEKGRRWSITRIGAVYNEQHFTAWPIAATLQGREDAHGEQGMAGARH